MNPATSRNGTTPPALDPLWMERQTLVEDFEHQLGVGRFPSVQEMEEEARVMVQGIADGRVQWPPADRGEWLNAAPGLQRWDLYPAAFDVHYIQAFSALPSVSKFMQNLDRSYRATAIQAARVLGTPVEDPSIFLNRTLHQLFLLTQWTRYGKRVYLLDDATYQALGETRLPRMPARYFSAPHPSFYVKLPPGAFHFRVAGDPVPQPVEGILVNFDQKPSDAQEAELERGREISLMVTGRSPRGADDDNLAFGSLLMGPDLRLSEARFEGLEDIQVGGKHNLADLIPRILFGLSLYLQSEHPWVEPVPPARRRDLSQIKNAGKRRKAEKQNERVSRLGYLYVRPPAGYAEEAEQQKGPSGSGRTLDERHWVDAYWRWTRHGPGWQQRKYHRIKGSWRGPKVAPEDAAPRRLKVQSARPAEVPPASTD